MKWQAYPKYKDSGVDWLSEVPEGWEVKKLGTLCNKIGSGKTPSGGATTYVDEGVIFLRSQNVYDDGLHLDDVAFITEDVDSEMQNTRVRDKDVLINITGGSIGRTCIVPDNFVPANVNQHVAIIRLSELNFCQFVAWVMKSLPTKRQIEKIQGGAARDGLTFRQIAQLFLALPPLEEQQTIVAFLDNETGRIDALVAKKKALIEKLKEQRTAIISSAVTKGLPPEVAPHYGLAPHSCFKPSGVDWLGDIPMGWKSSRLGYETWVRARLGWKGLKADEYVDEGFIFLATPNIKSRDIDFVNVNYITQERYDESPEIKLKQGDVLLAKDGSTLGTVNIVRFLPDEATVNSSIAVITPYKGLDGVYLMYLFLSKLMINTIQRVKGGMGVPHLFQSDLNKFYIPLPPFHEQQAIAAYLDEQTTKIDNLIAKVEQAIRTLQEYRSALITAAVTGKIDVRHTASMQEVL